MIVWYMNACVHTYNPAGKHLISMPRLTNCGWSQLSSPSESCKICWAKVGARNAIGTQRSQEHGPPAPPWPVRPRTRGLGAKAAKNWTTWRSLKVKVNHQLITTESQVLEGFEIGILIFPGSKVPLCAFVLHNFWQGTAWTGAIGHMSRCKSSVLAQSITCSQTHGNLQGWVNAQDQQTRSTYLTSRCAEKEVHFRLQWIGHELAPQVETLHCKMTYPPDGTSTKLTVFLKLYLWRSVAMVCEWKFANL